MERRTKFYDLCKKKKKICSEKNTAQKNKFSIKDFLVTLTKEVLYEKLSFVVQ